MGGEGGRDIERTVNNHIYIYIYLYFIYTYKLYISNTTPFSRLNFLILGF